MYEEQLQRKREEAVQNAAALVIQQCWHDYKQKLDEELELARGAAAWQATAVALANAAEKDAANGDGAFTEEPAEQTTESLLADYRRLLHEREELLDRNLACQRVLAKYFAEQRARKGESETGPLTTPEQEQQYWALVRQLSADKAHVAAQRVAAEGGLEKLRQEYQGTVDEAAMQEENFRQFIKETCEHAPFMRSHHTTIPAEEVAEFMSTDESLRARTQAARIRYIQLKNYEKKLKRSANDKDRRHNEGMYLIDFEQLKIENTNLNEKIEERNEDLVKLRRKVTTTIHVLAHVKEKLEFMKGENNQLRRQVGSTEDELNGVRDRLAQTKRRRDGYLKSNARLKEKMPLVGSEDLLMDYEQRKTDINDTRIKVVDLTDRHQRLLSYIKNQKPVVESLRKALSHYPT